MSSVTRIIMEEVMMKRTALIAVAIIALLGANQACANVCGMINGSFEDDGWVDFPPPPGEPNGWDVNVPAGEFYGYIHRDWPTEGTYNLTLTTNYFNTFEVNDIATVSQELDLTDVNEIIFDLRLDTDSSVWDSTKARAVVMIDGDLVWESDGLSDGEYLDQAYKVEDKYRDEALHTLSLGIRVIAAGRLYRTYYTDWDYIECTGFTYLAEDFNSDGFVNFLDLAELANYWGETAPAEYDLFPDGIIDLNDLGVFVQNWLK